MATGCVTGPDGWVAVQVCVDQHSSDLRKEGATYQRVSAVAAWRDTPYFTDAERAALALGEVMTRLSDRTDPIPYEIWEEACRHYNEAQLATLLLAIAAVNFFNRLHTATRRWHDNAAVGQGVLMSPRSQSGSSGLGPDRR